MNISHTSHTPASDRRVGPSLPGLGELLSCLNVGLGDVPHIREVHLVLPVPNHVLHLALLRLLRDRRDKEGVPLPEDTTGAQGACRQPREGDARSIGIQDQALTPLHDE